MGARIYSYIYDFVRKTIVSTYCGRDEQPSNGVEVTDYPFTKIKS